MHRPGFKFPKQCFMLFFIVYLTPNAPHLKIKIFQMFIYLPSSALHLSCQQHFPLQRVERFLILIISHIDNLFRQIITNLPGGISWCHNPEIKLFRHMCFFFFFYLICHGFYTIGRSSIVNRGCIDISLILIQQKKHHPQV